MTRWCFDTHGFYFWATSTVFEAETQADLDRRVQSGELWVSAVCFWELALLARKGRLAIADMPKWKEQVCLGSGIAAVDPSADDMIASTLLPDLHKDPFDRLLVAQARRRKSGVITRDTLVTQYDVATMWP
jgi:PIN domain nuclease of toxin-antitoxin system